MVDASTLLPRPPGPFSTSARQPSSDARKSFWFAISFLSTPWVSDCFFSMNSFFLRAARVAELLKEAWTSCEFWRLLQFPSVTSLSFCDYRHRFAKMIYSSLISDRSFRKLWLDCSEADLEQNLRLQARSRDCLKSVTVRACTSVRAVFLNGVVSGLRTLPVRASVLAHRNLGEAVSSGELFLRRKSSRSLFLLVSCCSFQGEMQPSSAASDRTRSFLPIIDKYINQTTPAPLQSCQQSSSTLYQILLMSRPEISISNSQVQQPPISPSNKNASSRSPKNQDPYLSRYAQELPEERLHKNKSKSIKLNQSAKDEKLQTTVKVNDNVVTVKEEKVLLNSTLNGSQVPGFEDPEYQEKKFKKFSITALIKEKDLVKESNYFDESHLGDLGVKPVVEKSRADFRIGEFEQFETFQVKTFLFDRNLTQKIDK